MGRLEGKTALITGGNSGIGLAAALAFVAEGARVAITGRDEATLRSAREALGPAGLAIRCDVARLADLDTVYAEIAAGFGKLDILFANAGISKPTPIETVTEAQYDEIFDVNAKGAYFTVQKALPWLRSGASVILNASIAALTGVPGFSAYGASKGAVRSLALLFAGDLAPRGIRVNLITPGAFSTNIWTRYGIPPEAMAVAEAKMNRRVPLGRMGRLPEISQALVFLASDESSYMTGGELVIDGGVSTVPAGAPAFRTEP